MLQADHASARHGNCLKFSGDGLGGSSVEVDISYCIDMNDMLVSRLLIHDMSLNSKTIRAHYSGEGVITMQNSVEKASDSRDSLAPCL